MWERLAYYTLRPVAPIYIMQATEPGGLHLTAHHKAWIYSLWAIFQSLLPTFTGGFADRYGYRLMLFVSITLNIVGFVLMAFFHNFIGFTIGIVVLATGTAFFKPSIQATIASDLNKNNSSLGWGIFYWVVNVGSIIGHYSSPLLLGNPHTSVGWRNLFLACAGFTALNYLMLLTIPGIVSGASKTETAGQVLLRTLRDVIEPRLLTWLLIMSCFWLMMYQLWDQQPNFIEDWVDSSHVAEFMPFESWRQTDAHGTVRVPQQVLISLNSLLIILFVVPVGILVRRLLTLSCMFWGMIMSTIGVLVAGWTGNGWYLLLGIFFFSLGETLTGPKKSEYLALIAPPGKVGLYLGYVNIPVGIGVFTGSHIAGYLYGHYGEKATLALKYLLTRHDYGLGRTWDGRIDTLEAAAGITRTEAFTKFQEITQLDSAAATQLLWDTFNPQYYVWLPIAAIGVAAAIALFIYGKSAKRWSDMNA